MSTLINNRNHNSESDKNKKNRSVFNTSKSSMKFKEIENDENSIKSEEKAKEIIDKKGSDNNYISQMKTSTKKYSLLPYVIAKEDEKQNLINRGLITPNYVYKDGKFVNPNSGELQDIGLNIIQELLVDETTDESQEVTEKSDDEVEIISNF